MRYIYDFTINKCSERYPTTRVNNPAVWLSSAESLANIRKQELLIKLVSNKRCIERRDERVSYGPIRFAHTKNTTIERYWSFWSRHAQPRTRMGPAKILPKISRTLEEAATAAFVMITPFSHGDPPLCSSQDAARFCRRTRWSPLLT